MDRQGVCVCGEGGGLGILHLQPSNLSCYLTVFSMGLIFVL